MKILIGNNPESLALALSIYENTATVEAEYGDIVVERSVLTLAHHGPRSDNECPCLFHNCYSDQLMGVLPVSIGQKWTGFDAIGVSHFDLDTLGGVLAVIGRKETVSDFWEIAAYVDIYGPHRIGDYPKDMLNRFDAFWAWSEKNRLFAPRDGSIMDCTEFFFEAERILNLIFNGDHELIEAGNEWAYNLMELNINSIKETLKTPEGINIVIRITDGPFVNAMYQIADSDLIADCVIGFNKKFGSFTLSFERPGIGNACEIMQAAFGPAAGGHAGIAGSPRGKALTYQAVENIIAHIR